jgi:hypothetical protein
MREREVPVYLYKTGAESDGKVEVEGKSHTWNTSGGIRDLCHMPVGVTYNTSCNHKHCTLTVTSTRTYYPTAERHTVTIRSSCIYPANKENTAYFHLWRNIQVEELTVACSPRGESRISHRPTNMEWAYGLVIQLFRLPVHKHGYYHLPYALYAIVV